MIQLIISLNAPQTLVSVQISWSLSGSIYDPQIAIESNAKRKSRGLVIRMQLITGNSGKTLN